MDDCYFVYVILLEYFIAKFVQQINTLSLIYMPLLKITTWRSSSTCLAPPPEFIVEHLNSFDASSSGSSMNKTEVPVCLKLIITKG